ncbi:MAG TPA: hypothetical protein VFN23_20890, partial [Ktedonobacteraceae bacterium]|nr:hypothetical protein [Ktedonobacteraceae bacterium]
MPKSAKHTIIWVSDLESYLLTEAEMDQSQQISDKDASWLEWLENHRAFAFNGRNGQLNLLKEKRQRGHEGYWYAYHRRSGGMTKRYLGLSMQLSLEKLEEISQLLQEDQKTANPPQDVEQFKTPDPVANFVQFEPLLMPKLQLPRLPKMLLPRERLWKLLDKGHVEHKLTVISAP